MSPKIVRHVALLVFTLLLAGLAYVLRLWHITYITPAIHSIIAFFFILSFVTILLTERALRQEAQRFVVVYLTTMVLRLLLSFAVVLFIVLQDFPDKLNIILNFAAVYLIFLVFEIFTLLTTLRANSEKGIKHVNKKIR